MSEATVNYADKFEKKVAESFKINSFTQSAVNHDYDFMGVDTIKVYSVDTVNMTDYNLKGGMQRYGVPGELTNTVKTYKLATDRAFTFTIDKRNNQDTMGVMEVGSALKRQIEQRVIPEVDKYRMGVICKGAKAVGAKRGKEKHVLKLANKSLPNAYANFLDAVTVLLDEGIPMTGCYAYISTEFYKAIRLDTSFIQASDMAQEMRLKGVVGMVEGIPLIHVPSAYFPTGEAVGDDSSAKVHFILTNKEAILGAEKLTDYKVHDNPPGVNGWLVEGRLRYDAFVLENKENMLVMAVATGK